MSGLIDNPQLTFDDLPSVETHKEEFGKDKAQPKTPKVIGKSKAEEWIKSLKEKQQEESKVKGQISLTGGASTSHRLTEFEIEKKDNEKEKLALAESLGAKAFKEGIIAPAHNKEFLKIIKDCKVGEAKPYLEAWNKGWIRENLHGTTELPRKHISYSEAIKQLPGRRLSLEEIKKIPKSSRQALTSKYLAETYHLSPADVYNWAIKHNVDLDEFMLKTKPGTDARNCIHVAVLSDKPLPDIEAIEAKPVHTELKTGKKSEVDALVENIMERVRASKTVKEAADINHELNKLSFKYNIPQEKMDKVYALIQATIDRLYKEKELKESSISDLIARTKAAKNREELDAVGKDVSAFLDSLPSVTGLRSETDPGMIVSRAYSERLREISKVQPITPEETAKMHAWGHKELDAIKFYRDQEIKKYQKNIDYVKREQKDFEELTAKLKKDPEDKTLKWNWKQARKTLETSLSRMPYWEKAIENYNSPEWLEKHKDHYHEQYIKEVKKAISTGKPVPADVIAQYHEFRKARDARERYEKGWKTSFANVSAAVVEGTKETAGVKVKRQDGKPITKQQIEEIVSGLKDVQDVIGNIIPVMKTENITVAHTSGKYPFLSQAGGMYHPTEKTVTMGIAGTNATAHEIAHFIDDIAKNEIPQTGPKYDLKLIGEAQHG